MKAAAMNEAANPRPDHGVLYGLKTLHVAAINLTGNEVKGEGAAVEAVSEINLLLAVEMKAYEGAACAENLNLN